MKPYVLALVMLAAPLAQAADAPGLTYYIQLVRGSDQDSPPAAQAKLVGARLDQRLHDIFKWKNYWEVKRETVTLHRGMKTRCEMSAQREVEIDWNSPKQLMISLYNDGKLTRKREQSIDTKFYIAGGDRDAADSWFIIVRKDNPGASQDMNTKLAGMP